VQWVVSGGEIAVHAARKARELAELPASALAVCKSCIAAAGDPHRDGFAEEIEASRRLYGEPRTRERVQALLDRSAQPERVS
jgi:hypothetical protein